ncbi:hypothetical protein [Tardiphaga sp. 709]|uniref:hypothetical protein n=1 Tax=Tardiphaga sp. 709 TaxID=3076039 RepID=UPI0028E8D469|nr:hypothetical protein [Tardiphaga sp. 709]WNV10168.1 hypothetical protein RSO67_02945 [Tardiphaga sp. 709]
MADRPEITGDFPSGATMQPRYMARTMTTYPISEPEMDQISSLSGQVTTRLSVATLLLGLATSIWTNAVFANEMTAAGQLATYYVAPVFIVFAIGYAVSAYWAHRKRTSAWEKIKGDASPMTAIAEAGTLMLSGARPAKRR